MQHASNMHPAIFRASSYNFQPAIKAWFLLGKEKKCLPMHGFAKYFFGEVKTPSLQFPLHSFSPNEEKKKNLRHSGFYLDPTKRKKERKGFIGFAWQTNSPKHFSCFRTKCLFVDVIAKLISSDRDRKKRSLNLFFLSAKKIIAIDTLFSRLKPSHQHGAQAGAKGVACVFSYQLIHWKNVACPRTLESFPSLGGTSQQINLHEHNTRFNSGPFCVSQMN